MQQVAEMEESDFSEKKQLPLASQKSALSVKSLKPKSQISGQLKTQEAIPTPQTKQESTEDPIRVELA